MLVNAGRRHRSMVQLHVVNNSGRASAGDEFGGRVECSGRDGRNVDKAQSERGEKQALIHHVRETA